MKRVLRYIIIVGFISSFVSCDEKFEEMNTPKANPADASLATLLTGGQEYSFGQIGYFWERYANIFTQHLAGNHADGVSWDRYQLQPADNSNLFFYLYTDGLSNLEKVIELGKGENAEEASPHYVGVAQIQQALILGHLTDLYGDIPWTEAMKGLEYPFPNYDSQEKIYNTIQSLLDEGISNIKNDNSVFSPGSDDLIFNGDLGKWMAAAYAIKARYANHLSKIDPVGSAQAALDAIDKAEAVGFSDMLYAFEGSANHFSPWWSHYQNSLAVASDNFMDLLVDNNDPRLERYFSEEKVDGTFAGYVGKQNGKGTDDSVYPSPGEDTFFGAKDASIFLMTRFELLFIKAEAHLRLNQKGEAANAHNEAIAVSLQSVGATDNGYLVSFATEDATTIDLEKVMTEKYKAMFTQGVESWVDVRRHDYQYPTNLEIPEGELGGPTSDEYIRRVLYSSYEVINNPNVPKDITVYKRVWWDN
ncbi:SusD/RagB family nutrient-binding outer membrane lipoprotein [Xanthovirga aplysinae]|uniref:SusD/RagB family nutrient-binding outer membrane lipoprotein n=1 Tax=Xanthovirga aplysinae TaxID=2529853 RepID=UPI0012BBF57C|nr:SusD/RagB family nutrient-binding outer membrane lipoprotein [Xanthovirga aplysinae]MTI30792.1 SusD/RagB family nutrient-binding outer membrane lipoprotein [Xanthovirga aplysinae]